MSEIKVDTIVDAAGTGKPNFSNGVTMNGAALSTLNLGEYNASSSEPSSPQNGSVWWDTTNEKIFIYIAGEWKETIGIAAQIAWGGTRGFRLGGNASNVIGYFDIQNSGNATDFGDIGGSGSNYGGGQVSNGTRIVVGLGISNYSGSQIVEDQMQYITCATSGNATNFGNHTQGKYKSFGCSNGTRGVFMGGKNTSYTTIDDMDYITIDTTGDATDFGDLFQFGSYTARAAGAVISGSTRGVYGGGQNDASNGHDDMQYITIATTGNASEFGDLGYRMAETSGASDLTRGLFMGGSGETGGAGNFMNTISYITMDTTGSATDFGDLTRLSQGSASCADNTYACCYGGYDWTGSSAPQVNIIDRVTVQTTGNASDHGDLTDTACLYTQGASGNAS